MHTTAITQSFCSIISAIAAGNLEELDAHIRYDVVDHNLILGLRGHQHASCLGSEAMGHQLTLLKWGACVQGVAPGRTRSF